MKATPQCLIDKLVELGKYLDEKGDDPRYILVQDPELGQRLIEIHEETNREVHTEQGDA